MSLPNDARRDEIKRTLTDPWRVAELLGLTEGAKRQASGLHVRCPSHNENTPSCSITVAPDGGLRVRCFACEFSGDVLSLVAAVRGLDMRRQFPQVIDEAAKIAGLDAAPAPTHRPYLQTVPPAATVADLGAEWAALSPVDAESWEYLRGRGLEEAADLCREAPRTGPLAAVAPGFAVAMRDATGRVVAIQARNLSATAHDFRVLGASKSGLFGTPQAVAKSATVVVCEGLTDTLAALLGFTEAKSTAVVGIAGVQVADALQQLPWKGKRALIAMDADDRGDEAAKVIADMVAKAGGTPVRLRPEGTKDLAAMHAAGVNLLAFARGAAGRSMGFRTFGERVEGERDRRMVDAGKALSYGVAFLDAITGGIVPRDVILLGAESGLGKTELATIIAMTAATVGKRVHYFALEPEPDEIERRIKFKYLSRVVAESEMGRGVHLNFQDWKDGKQERWAAPFEEQATRVLTDRYRTLHTFYRHERKGPFTAEDFDRMARALQDESDLIVLDHTHYFDEGEDANRSQKRNAMAFRDLAVQTGRPLIQIAHLRKKSSQPRKAPRLVPERDDFEGSSHLFKPVKRAIILAPAFAQKRTVPWLWPTYIALVKNTTDSTRCRYVGMVGFNARVNNYEEGFVLGQLTSNGEKFENVTPEDMPYWAQQDGQQEIPE